MLGLRLDVALSEMLPDQSRSKITAWIKSCDALIVSKEIGLKLTILYAMNLISFRVPL